MGAIMGDIVSIKGAAQDPDHVLEESKGEFGSVLVIGWDHEGQLDVRASLNLDAKDCLWLVEQFKHGLISGDYSE
jgi:hypothetical protein